MESPGNTLVHTCGSFNCLTRVLPVQSTAGSIACTPPWLHPPCCGTFVQRVLEHLSLHSLQLQLSCQGVLCAKSTRTSQLVPTSFSAILAGYFLCEERKHHRNPCLLQLSSPALVGSAWRALGSLDLYPLQLQLSCHSAICMEIPKPASLHTALALAAHQSAQSRTPQLTAT